MALLSTVFRSRRRSLGFVLAGGLVVGIAGGMALHHGAAKKKGLWFPEPVVHIGQTTMGQQVDQSFPFRNLTGDVVCPEDVVVRTACPSCMGVAAMEDCVSPGEWGRVGMGTVFHGPPGKAERVIFVTHKSRPDVLQKLVLKTELVPKPLQVSPARLDFGHVTCGESVHRRIFVACRGKLHSLTNLRTDVPGLECKVVEDRSYVDGFGVEAKLYAIDTVFEAQGRPGEVRGQIVAQLPSSDPPDTTTLCVPVRAVVSGRIRVLPPNLFFGRLRPDEVLTRSAEVKRHRDIAKLQVHCPENTPWFRATLEREPAEKKLRLVVTVGPGAPRGALDTSVSIHAPGQGGETVTVPIAGLVVSPKSP